MQTSCLINSSGFYEIFECGVKYEKYSSFSIMVKKYDFGTNLVVADVNACVYVLLCTYLSEMTKSPWLVQLSKRRTCQQYMSCVEPSVLSSRTKSLYC